MNKRIGLLFCVVLSLSTATAAQKESNIQKTKGSVNGALSQFADGLHQALHGAKKGGNSFFQQVGDGIHQLWHQLTDPAPSKKQKNK